MVRKNKKWLVAVAVALLVVGAFIIWKKTSSNNSVPKSTEDTAEKKDTINYDPPSEQDKEDVNNTKERLGEEQSSAPTPSTNGKKNASPVVTSAFDDGTNIQVMGFVGGVVENNGQCTYVFTKDSSKVSKTTTAQADASTSRCSTLAFPRAELTAGSWSVIMNYTSPSAQGSSNTLNLEVQR